jgi:hypothetical protein
MDVAVRDARADETTGWVFGTFVYDADEPAGDPWRRMAPLGLMWGNDPTITPNDIKQGKKLKETWINPNLRTLKYQHLGWAGRLNGPIDNSTSSCLSCHATAQSKGRMPMIPDLGYWFRNVKAGQTFNDPAQSLDYSLQLAQGIQNWEFAKNQTNANILLHKPQLVSHEGRRVYRFTREDAADAPLMPAADFAQPAPIRLPGPVEHRMGWFATPVLVTGLICLILGGALVYLWHFCNRRSSN